jgi:hypothetical protein
MPFVRRTASRVSRFAFRVTPPLRRQLPNLAELTGAVLLVTAAFVWHPVVGLASAGVILVAAANARA